MFCLRNVSFSHTNLKPSVCPSRNFPLRARKTSQECLISCSHSSAIRQASTILWLLRDIMKRNCRSITPRSFRFLFSFFFRYPGHFLSSANSQWVIMNAFDSCWVFVSMNLGCGNCCDSPCARKSFLCRECVYARECMCLVCACACDVPSVFVCVCMCVCVCVFLCHVWNVFRKECMCVCVCVYVCVCSFVCIYFHSHAFKDATVCARACVHVCLCLCAHTYTRVHVRIYSIWEKVCDNIYIYIYIYIYICVCVCVCGVRVYTSFGTTMRRTCTWTCVYRFMYAIISCWCSHIRASFEKSIFCVRFCARISNDILCSKLWNTCLCVYTYMHKKWKDVRIYVCAPPHVILCFLHVSKCCSW